jgi:hypothetical protein
MGYKGGYNEARRWNREVYNQYQTDRTESRDRFNQNVTEAEALRQRTLADYDKLSDQDKIDFQRAQEASMAAQNQALASRGLSGSSIANNAYAGNSRETAYGLNRIADERQKGRIGYDVGLTADLINLKQAGPTAPSTAMFQATTQNLQAAMSYKLQQQQWDESQKGLNQSWSRGYSQYTSPGRIFPLISQMSGAAAGAALGGGLGAGSGFGTGLGAMAGSGQGNNSYTTAVPGMNSSSGSYDTAGSGYRYGSATSAMTQGQGGSSVFQTNRI